MAITSYEENTLNRLARLEARLDELTAQDKPNSGRTIDLEYIRLAQAALEISNTGVNVTSSIELGGKATGNRYAYVDLKGDDTYTDYSLRLIRHNTGANADSELAHRGTGVLALTAVDLASVVLKTQNTERARIGRYGGFSINRASDPYTYLDVWGPAITQNSAPYEVFRLARAGTVSNKNAVSFGIALGEYTVSIVSRTKAMFYLAHDSYAGNNFGDIPERYVGAVFSDGRWHFAGNTIVDADSTSNSQAASISLAIGDSDTGFDWVQDGVVRAYGNNAAVFSWSSTYLEQHTPVMIAPFGTSGNAAFRLLVQTANATAGSYAAVFRNSNASNLMYLENNGYSWVNQNWAVGSSEAQKSSISAANLDTLRKRAKALKNKVKRYKQRIDPNGGDHYGFIAEDNEQELSDLIVRSKLIRPARNRTDENDVEPIEMIEETVLGIRYGDMIPQHEALIGDILERIEPLEQQQATHDLTRAAVADVARRLALVEAIPAIAQALKESKPK